jgi:phosphomannomutase
MNCEVSGIFAHTPEPLPENLTALCDRVKQTGADLGIAVDPDVDRLVLITEKGEPFGEEYTVASVVQFVLSREISNPPSSAVSGTRPIVVVNLSTTRAVEDLAARFGAEVQRTAVGEINVARRMKETGALVGGEGSGGIILPSVHLGRDAPVGIGLILQQLLDAGGTLSELKASLPQYAIVKDKVEIGSRAPDDILRSLEAQWSGKGKINREDGVKVDFPHSWVHFRKSNTEPIVRIIAEAPTGAEANELLRRSREAIHRLL